MYWVRSMPATMTAGAWAALATGAVLAVTLEIASGEPLVESDEELAHIVAAATSGEAVRALRDDRLNTAFHNEGDEISLT